MDIQKEREAFLHEFEKTEQYRQQYGFYKIPLKYDEQKETWNFYDVQAAWEMWQAAKAQAVPEGFILVPKEPTEAMIQRGTKANSECLNENAPLGERLFRHPALQVYQAMVNGSGE